MRLRRVFVSLFFVLAALTAVAAWLALRPLQFPAERIEFHIKSGSSLRTIASQLADAGVPVVPWQFRFLGRVAGRAQTLKAGSYELDSGTSAWHLLDKFTRGDVTQGDVILVEGWTFRQFRAALDQNTDLDHQTRGLPDAAVMEKLGLADKAPEGMFFPDTYYFDKKSSDMQVLRRAYAAMQQQLAQLWQQRDPANVLRNSYEALVLASVVEKETGSAVDRGNVASVFVNRLRANMPLQSDPTVIYGLGERFDGNLRKRDLLADTPFNTYTRAGLPPTPIAMPGLASLRAALRPASTNYLYFVARGDGSSEFSRTLDEHNRAVQRYQRKRGGSS
ncbi:MAG: endolytic transglycosylase MltG [Rhodocyclaceae bacterium]|nr:endolytic transglycosylase MltG [Rhodocyclaceae bacterium]MBX3670007.1 endolytic transglycosylase MltG [Rhodocyclaceae bacterium]